MNACTAAKRLRGHVLCSAVTIAQPHLSVIEIGKPPLALVVQALYVWRTRTHTHTHTHIYTIIQDETDMDRRQDR